MSYRRAAFTAFTLAEVLISLALIGIIAAFTIPKVLNSTSQNSRYHDLVMDDVAALQSVFNGMRLKGELKTGLMSAGGTTAIDIMSRINHLGRRSTGEMDISFSLPGTIDCTVSTIYCYDMPNGTGIFFTAPWGFLDSTETSAIVIGVDPDTTKVNPVAGASGKSINWLFYYNGQSKSAGRCVTTGTFIYNALTGTASGVICPNPTPPGDPDWFKFR